MARSWGRVPSRDEKDALAGNAGTPSPTNKFSTEEGLVIVEDNAGVTYGPDKRIKFVNGSYVTYTIADAGEYIAVQVNCSPPATTIPRLHDRVRNFYYNATSTGTHSIATLYSNGSSVGIVLSTALSTGGTYTPALGCTFSIVTGALTSVATYSICWGVSWNATLQVRHARQNSIYTDRFGYGTQASHNTFGGGGTGKDWVINATLDPATPNIYGAGIGIVYPT